MSGKIDRNSSGTVDRYHYIDDKLVIETVQDVEPILEANKRAFNDASRTHKSETFNKVASIPMVIWMQWCQKKGISYQESMQNDDIMRLFLNDPDNKPWRTRPGRI